MKIKYSIYIFLIWFCSTACQKKENYTSWQTYRGDSGANCYSSLNQINRQNVVDLRPAWIFHTGDAGEGTRTTIECNPIIANKIIYFTSPRLKLFALDAATGEKIWSFNPFGEGQARSVNRGVSYWEKGNDRRILYAAHNKLHALNATTGIPIFTFGNNGFVDLREGLERDTGEIYVSATSPGVVYNDLLILGHATTEGDGAAPGHIRAYDIKTGKMEWSFRTIPQPGEFGYDTWEQPDAWQYTGGANAWAGLALDKKRGIVYCPTGSAAPDFYGGYRKGENLFANTLLALDAATGKRIWHFQAVHHDLWDYDLPSTPNLISLQQEGKKVDAVAQITKMGHVFVFNRENGQPLFPVEERPVPPSDIEGEGTWPTQPFPVRPPPFVRQKYTENDLPDISEEARMFAIQKLDSARNEGIFTPLSTNGTVVFPGFRGGGEWSGASFDFETGILYVNANEIPNLVSIRKLENKGDDKKSTGSEGERLYRLHCALCHGTNREGQEVFPSLVNVGQRVRVQEMHRQMKEGQGLMPAFPHLGEKEREAIIAYLLDTRPVEITEEAETNSTGSQQERMMFAHSGYAQFLDEQGYPAVKPPWGTLSAIDMNKGEILWQQPLGEFPELTARGIPLTGTQNFGGSMVTAGGLVFIGATADEKFRAFDKTTGELLWEYKLPFGGYATPATYEVDGIQYVVIAAGGGGRVGTKSGDAYVAFSLP